LPGTVADDALAYVIFHVRIDRQGRKAVMIEHRGLSNLLARWPPSRGSGPGETLLGVTTPAFDLSRPDLYLPLVTGAGWVLANALRGRRPRSPRLAARTPRRVTDAGDALDLADADRRRLAGTGQPARDLRRRAPARTARVRHWRNT